MILPFLAEVRGAARTLRRSPAFSVTTFVTLALGIGAASAVFSIFNAVLLNPLPWGAPDRAVMIWSRWNAFDKTWVADGEVLDYRRRMTSVLSVAAWGSGSVNITGGGEPERVGSAAVTANLFDTLAAPLVLGRPFTAQEDTPGAPRVAIISYDIWQRRFGGQRGVIGRGVQLNGEGYAIVGVTSRGFALPTDYASPDRTQVFTPLQIDPRAADHASHGLYAAARLKPGATAAQATAELHAITRAMTREGLYPEAMQFSASAVSLRDEVVGNVRPAVIAVFGAVGFLLLIACANVANLMLARAESRHREIAVRTALGASPGRIVQHIVMEGLTISVAAGVAGLFLSAAAARWIAWWNPAGIPRLAEARVDPAVAIFTFAMAIVVAVVFSAAPAWRVLRGGFSPSLKEGSQNTTAGGRRQRFRAALVVSETALAAVLLVGAGLMVRTLVRLQSIPLGLDPANVLTLHVSLPASSYPSGEAAVQFYRRLVGQVRAIPGVRNAAAVRSLPLASAIGDFGLRVDGYDPPRGQHAKGDWQIVTDGYLETLGERLLRGRTIRASDDENGMLIGLVNEEMARKYWAGRDPIGGRFRIGGAARRPWIAVVGVVADVRHNGVTEPVKEKFYIPHAQWHRSVGPMGGMYLVVRGTGERVEQLLPSIRASMRSLDPNVPVARVRTMEDVVAAALSRPRFTSALFTIFSALALLLAALGIYGVLAYVVTQRTREIGIRLAIGASPSAVAREVLGRGLALAAAGVAVGGALALALGRAIGGLLYGVAAGDPATFATGAAVLLGVAAAASYLPARRATMVDPVLALKAE